MFVSKAKYNDLAEAFDEMERQNNKLADQNGYLRAVIDNLVERDVQARNPKTGRFERVKIEGL